MTIHQKIKADITEALRAKDTIRLNTLRNLNALFANETLSSKSNEQFLADDKVLPIIKRSVKQHKDSIEQFDKGGRKDLSDVEHAELAILETFLPASMGQEEIESIVKARIESMKADGSFDPKSMGKIIGMIMKEFAGKADGAAVKRAIDKLLA